jgi:putative aldouronate transport system substrate-binding protein
MWSAGDQLPDLFAVDQIGSSTFHAWVKDGIVKEIPDLTSYPNIKAIFDMNPDIAATAVDGKYYMLPRLNAIDGDEYTWGLSRLIMYRKDWAEAAGAAVPNTPAEFAAFVKKIQDSKPEGKNPAGLVTYNVGFLNTCLSLCFAPGVDPSTYVKNEAGQYEPLFFQPRILDSLNYMRKLYQDGIIDPDYAIAKTTESMDKFATGNAVAVAFQMIIPADFSMYFSDRFESVYPGRKATDAIAVLPPLKNDQDGNRYIFTTSSFWSESYINGYCDDAKTAKIMEFMDFMASDEFKSLARYGIEGVDYTKNGDEITITRETDANGTPIDLASKYPFLNGFKFLTAWDIGVTPVAQDTSISDDVRSFMLSARDAVSSGTTLPELRYDLPYISTPLKDQLVLEIGDDITRIVTGTDPVEAMYQETVQKYKDKGYDAMIAEFNAALD